MKNEEEDTFHRLEWIAGACKVIADDIVEHFVYRLDKETPIVNSIDRG